MRGNFGQSYFNEEEYISEVERGLVAISECGSQMNVGRKVAEQNDVTRSTSSTSQL